MSHDTDHTCPCVTEHRPKAVELDLHHILPRYLGGRDAPENWAWVCPNTHRATHELLRLYMQASGPPPGDVVNDFPSYARHLAAEGYRLWRQTQ